MANLSCFMFDSDDEDEGQNEKATKVYKIRRIAFDQNYRSLYRFTPENVQFLIEQFMPEYEETRGGALNNGQKMHAFLRYVGDPGFQINDGNSAADQQGRLRETVRFIRQVAAENSIGENESKDVSNSESSVIDELTVDSSETEADERNKRFLFNFIGQSSGGGSGNFLFDVIRLFSSSGPNQSTAGLADDSGVSVTTEAGTNTADGYTETIPGPVTRLFVLANRGISNLIQDLILRIAQTSERVVNFKARLVTSLI